MRMAPEWQGRLRLGAILLGVSALLALISPYGATAALPYWAAFLYWASLIFCGSLIGFGAMRLIQDRFPGMKIGPSLALISLLTALAGTGAVAALHAGPLGEPIPAIYLPTLFGLVWVIAAAMTGLSFLLARSGVIRPEPAGETGDPVRNFLQRLPMKYRQAELWAISSEDHYIRVHTSLGEELILMRLTDALRELAGADGLQVHRSWWVARPGITDTRRDGGKVLLVLASGKAAPVSRSFLAEAKAAGLA